MPSKVVEQQHVETATGTYKLERVVIEHWVVWSPRSGAPVGNYDSLNEATQALNSIRVGQPIPHQRGGQLESLVEVVGTAELLSSAWGEIPQELPLVERCLQAALQSEHYEECRAMADLALETIRLQKRDQ